LWADGEAWSTIVKVLIPNTEVIEAHLKSFAEVLGAEEVVLFERTTFLVVAHVSIPSATTAALDPQRFEKLSSIIKSFKLSCGSNHPPFPLSPFTTHSFLEGY
jgi:Ras-related GTP-binding protein A/B